MSKNTALTVTDDTTGQEHCFHVSTDAYGVVVKHGGTKHSVCFEVFDGRLQVLVFRAGDDSPTHQFKFD